MNSSRASKRSAHGLGRARARRWAAGMALVALAVFWATWSGAPDTAPRVAPPRSVASQRPGARISRHRILAGWSAAPAEGRRPASDPYASLHQQLRQWRETSLDDAAARERRLQALLAMLTDGNAGAIVRSLSPDELHADFGTAALDRWLSVDAPAAAAWVAARPDATEAQAWLVARRLLADPDGLAAFCDRLPESPWRQSLLTAAGAQELPRDPARSLDLAARLAPGPARSDLLQTIAYSWTGNDPTAAMNWIMGVGDSSLRESLIAAGAKALAATDPDLAARWLAASVRTPDLARDTALCIAETWADENPAAAAAWVTHFPSGSARVAAVDAVLHHWLPVDREAATRWFSGLRDARPILDQLAAGEAAVFDSPDPE